MEGKDSIKPITNNDLDNLLRLIRTIDPKNKVFGVTNVLISEKKKIKSYKSEDKK